LIVAWVALIALHSASRPQPEPPRDLIRQTSGAADAQSGSAGATQSGSDGAHPAYTPFIAPRSSEPQLVMKGFKIPDGFTIDCFASEPDVAQPVCFTFGQDGACYVAETFRHHTGVADIRDHMSWLDDDVASRSVEDRVAMLHKHLGADFWKYELAPERICVLRDTDHDGHVDKSTVFADPFRAAPDGIGAGLLEHHGDVYYTCIPDMWRLRDKDGDDRADVIEKMSTGWGIRVSLLGHDMHGLAIGPDGKL
jgi:quinoprotein glucose dehydrogenase